MQYGIGFAWYTFHTKNFNISLYLTDTKVERGRGREKMTVLAVFSYGFIAYGPAVVLFIVTVARHAYEVILLMSG